MAVLHRAINSMFLVIWVEWLLSIPLQIHLWRLKLLLDLTRIRSRRLVRIYTLQISVDYQLLIPLRILYLKSTHITMLLLHFVLYDQNFMSIRRIRSVLLILLLIL